MQKDVIKDQKELENLYREVDIVNEMNEKLEEKVDDPEAYLADAK